MRPEHPTVPPDASNGDGGAGMPSVLGGGANGPSSTFVMPPVIDDRPDETAVVDESPGEDAPLPPEVEKPPVSLLGEPPDWASLEIYQETITREDFLDLLTRIFTTGDAWMESMVVERDFVRVRTTPGEEGEDFILRFAASSGRALPIARTWRPAEELPPAPADRPLDGIHLAIDPGHIGGAWAKMEGRWFSLDGDPPVTEGDMTLKVAQMLQPALEMLGARVSLVREHPEPITSMRPGMLEEIAADEAGDDASPLALQRLAERLFYRTAEIRARAHVVNHAIRPDLVLCLHFNAEAWGNPARPTLVKDTHFHILLNGGYTDSEISLVDQRFAMLRKLLQRTHEEEARVGATVADVFARVSGLPPYTYTAKAGNVRPVGDHPYLWARNLLANRLYDCPVIFMEPYVMNSRLDYARIQAGDYDGLREFGGRQVPSIYREYVNALADGLAKHYREIRGVPDAPAER